jgi:enoyl-CoA hydratase
VIVRTAVDGRVARVLIDRPEAHNALSPAVLDGLDAALDTALATRCSVLVLRGAGGSLSAGADLPHLRTLLGDAAAVEAYITRIGAVLDRIEAAPLVSVAVVTGYALAGGCEILLACDLAVVADEARIGDRHLEYGLLPGAGGSVRLPRALPGPLARRLLYTGEMIDGATAATWGLASHHAPADALDAAVEELVARLARHSPDALAGMKAMYRAGLDTPPAAALAAERAALLAHLDSPTVAEGLAAFAGHRPPDFAGDRFPVRCPRTSTGLLARSDDASQRRRPREDARYDLRAVPCEAPPDSRDRPGKVHGHRTSPGGSMTDRPVTGRWFEELDVGTVVRHATRRTVTETDNVLFTTMTMNPAPLHLDADYAAGTEFGRPLVNSMFTVALVVGLSVYELTLGTIVAQLGMTDVVFPAPVFAGDTIRVETEVVEARPSKSRPDTGIVVFEHRAHNQRDELVCRCRRTGLMHRKPVS